MSEEFIAWPEIKQYKNGIHCIVTEKVHGSNAQVLVIIDESVVVNEDFSPEPIVKAGSRTRWLSPGKETDNYGFAQWVEDRKAEIVEKLGPGRHYAEFYGSGINHGYGLKEKRLALFNTRTFPPERPRPEGVDVVPVLYSGPFSPEAVQQIMLELKANGSRLVPGNLSPEGIVIHFPAFGHSMKMVFAPEETGWTGKPGKKGDKIKRESIDISSFLQPIRLEKLLSRDSNYREQYPASLTTIVKDYILDMEKEEQFKDVDDQTIKAVRKGVYPFVKTVMETL